jgi:hypothetical protein
VTFAGAFAYLGGVLLPDGRVFCVAHNSTSSLIYDPIKNTLTTPAGVYPGSGAYADGVLLPDGRVFCVPILATTARIAGSAVTPISKNRVLSPYFNKL